MRAHGAAFGAWCGALLMWPIPWWLVVAGLAGVAGVTGPSGLAGRSGARWSGGPAAAASVPTFFAPLSVPLFVSHFTSYFVPFFVALFMLASSLGAHALAGLDPLPSEPVDVWVEVVGDPRPAGPVGVRFDGRVGDARVSVSGHGPIAGRLDDLQVGDRIRIRGSQRPTRSGDEWARWRHQRGSISVSEVIDTATSSPMWRGTSALRAALAGGAESLDRDDQAVFLGMVIGDDRGQSAVVADDFRAAGLGHLLVVSGQNVAFVLAVLAPLTAGLRPAGRVAVLALALGLFAAVTRFEPSVLRAVAMAGVGIVGTALGSPVDGRRGLSLAMAGLLIVDPFLARVLAFQLSAAATAGIVWLSPALDRVVPGPTWLRLPIVTTTAAQAGVAPLLIATFGPMPLAALPANLLAGPVSGPIMMWGSTAGLLAGVVGGPVAVAVHLPTAALLWWVRGVAAVAAAAPYATLSASGVTAIAVGLAFASRSGFRAVGVGVVGATMAASLVGAPQLGPGSYDTGAGGVVHVTEAGVVLELADPGAPRRIVEQLRTMGVRDVVAIVAVDGDAADARAVIALRDRFPAAVILAPPMHRVPGAQIVRAGEEVMVAGVATVLTAEGGQLAVTVFRGR